MFGTHSQVSFFGKQLWPLWCLDQALPSESFLDRAWRLVVVMWMSSMPPRLIHLLPSQWNYYGEIMEPIKLSLAGGSTSLGQASKVYSLSLLPVPSLLFPWVSETVISQLPVLATIPSSQLWILALWSQKTNFSGICQKKLIDTLLLPGKTSFCCSLNLTSILMT